MDMPEWIDTDIIYSVGYWMLTIGTIIAFLLGFKMADGGLFGLVDSANAIVIPLWNKIILLLVTPIISYVVALKFFS